MGGTSGESKKRPVKTVGILKMNYDLYTYTDSLFQVVTSVLNTLKILRASSTKLMPLAAGLLYLGFVALFDLFR